MLEYLDENKQIKRLFTKFQDIFFWHGGRKREKKKGGGGERVDLKASWFYPLQSSYLAIV